jgi:hypothetical protein
VISITGTEGKRFVIKNLSGFSFADRWFMNHFAFHLLDRHRERSVAIHFVTGRLPRSGFAFARNDAAGRFAEKL